MLQNTDNILQTIVKKEPAKNSLSTVTQVASQTTQKMLKPIADTIDKLNDYFDSDWGEPEEDGYQRTDNLDFGSDTLDFFKGNDVTIAENGIQNLSEGRIENPIEKEMPEVTKIRLVPEETDDNTPKYKFVVDETTPNKKAPTSKDNSPIVGLV
jgi:hypothetical protein